MLHEKPPVGRSIGNRSGSPDIAMDGVERAPHPWRKHATGVFNAAAVNVRNLRGPRSCISEIHVLLDGHARLEGLRDEPLVLRATTAHARALRCVAKLARHPVEGRQDEKNHPHAAKAKAFAQEMAESGAGVGRKAGKGGRVEMDGAYISSSKR